MRSLIQTGHLLVVMLDARRQITRNRISYSCQNCRRRKIKCTKTHPSCDECLKTKEKCVYESKSHLVSSPENAGDSHTLGKRKSGASHAPSEVEDAPSTQDQSHLNELDMALSKLEEIVAKHLILITQEYKNSDQQDLSKFLDRLNRISSSIKSSSRRDIPQYATTSESPVRVQATKILPTRKFMLSPSPSQDTDLQYSFIPSQQQSNVLFRNWLLSVYPILPIINPTEVLIKYEIFHQWYRHGCDKGIPNPVKNFMPMIFAIHYAGIVSMSVRGLRTWWPGVSRRILLTISLDHYTRSINSLKSPDRNKLTAKVIMYHLCRDAVNDSQVGSSSVAAIIRDAQMLGLHRSSLQNGLTSSGECDRRLWWEIVSLDANIASSTNLPLMTNEHYFDTTPPSEIKDNLLGTTEGARYDEELRSGNTVAQPADDPRTTGRRSPVSIHFMISRLRARLTSSTRELMSMTLGVEKLTKKDLVRMQQILSAAEAEIKGVIDRIPAAGTPEMDVGLHDRPGQMSPMDDESFYAEKLTLAEVVSMLGEQPIEEPHLVPYMEQSKLATMTFHKWARIYLSALLDQIYSLSYGPFMRSLKSKMWLVARQCLLKHCHSFTRKYIVLAINPEVQCFRWTWTSLLQPMHSSLLLLLDLYERPDSVEAARSRALIDHMLSLSLTDHGIVGGDYGITFTQPLDECGGEARNLLLDLRNKAWQRAGLDPTVLWTEQDQIQIGAAKVPTDADLLARSMREDTIHESEAGSSASSREILRAQFRQVVLTVTGEVWHPSELGELPDISEASPLLQPISEGGAQPRASKLLRARHDQEPLPIQNQEQWLRVPEGHVTSLNDIDQLLQKIKDAKSTTTKSSEIVSEPVETDLVTSPDTMHHSAPPLSTRHKVHKNHQRGGDQNFHIRHQPNIGQQQQKECEESESGQVAGQTVDSQFTHDFDWKHWDSVFASLDEVNLTDMVDTNASHVQDRDMYFVRSKGDGE